MIKSLSIKNYALIQSLEMFPSPNLNIITGETGAGKSIMLGAVGLLLGNRADTRALFSEDEKCVVEGVFDLHQYHLESVFAAHDLDYDTECIIRREISPQGKSRAFINDTPVTLDVLKSLSIHLMDIHSQHESLHLGNNLYQLEILDIFCGNSELMKTYKKAYLAFKIAEKNYQKLLNTSQENAKESDYKQFLYNELAEASLEEGELERLEEELEVLENAEEIKTNLSQLTQLLDESEFSLVNQAREALPLLSPIKGYSKKLEEIYERINAAAIELQDIVSDVANEQDRVELDPERLQIVKGRIDLLFRLQQKHQVISVEALIGIRDELAATLEKILSIDDEITAAGKDLTDTEKTLKAAGTALSHKRKSEAAAFAKAIEGLIRKLGIENGTIEIKISTIDPSPEGMDLVEMLFSANKGVQPREIKLVASGGEFSRLIFAIKYLLADKTALPTIIFDEIDTGVSGEIALQMVSMMKKMSRNHQVISISHLPQFAAGGDAHYFVYKDHSAAKSVSKIKKLDNNERVLAIARMIGGDNPGENAMESARDLLKVG